MNKKRVYVIFDHATDLLTFSEIKSKCSIEANDKSFVAIENSADGKEKTLEENIYFAIKSASVVLVLVDANSKYLGGLYSLEIEYALQLQKPIVVVNKNNARSMDLENCPMILRDKFVLHVSIDPQIINYAIEVWPLYFQDNICNDKHCMYFDEQIYKKYNL